MIKFFGCSFTQGGGLDNIDYYNWINNTSLEYNHQDAFKQLELFRNEHRFTKIVSDRLGIESENFAVSRGSNNYSLEKLFNEIENNEKEEFNQLQKDIVNINLLENKNSIQEKNSQIFDKDKLKKKPTLYERTNLIVKLFKFIILVFLL